MSKTIPTPIRDELFDEPIDEPAPDSFDRAFWVGYLRDLHDFDADVLADKPDGWLWSRAQEVLR